MSSTILLYLVMARCVGVPRPLPPPRIVVRPQPFIYCGRRKLCNGTFNPTTRTIVVTHEAFSSTLDHEYVHDLLTQKTGDGDADHRSDVWARCTE